MKSLNTLMKDKNNNYDFIRLVAAVIVILSHSFPLSMGYIKDSDPDPLFQLTGHFSMGHIAVMIFFIISGFLITQSYDRTKKPISFLKARILRIFPGLVFVVLLTVFVLGPLITNLPIQKYFSLKSTYDYFKNITLYFMVFPLPGTFENNAYPNAINGSLWTLIYEFKCYLGVLFLGVFRLLRKEVILILFVASSVLYMIGHIGSDIEFLTYFSAGMLVYMFREKIVLYPFASIISTAIAIVSLIFYQSFLMPLITLCVTYTILCLTYSKTVKINGSKLGDFSYGTYIFAFPIQQSVTYYFGGSMDWWLNFLISLPITLIFASISWHLIEKQALKYKKVSTLKRPLFIKRAR